MDEKTRDNVAENEIERMEDLGQALEESYAHMGNGEYDTDTLLAWEKINEYKEAGTILPVTISGIVNKGVIALVEGVRGFIPVSRLDINHVEDTLDWLGRDIRVRVIEADMERNKLVLSAREILREESEAARKAQREMAVSKIEVGSVVEGKVIYSAIWCFCRFRKQCNRSGAYFTDFHESYQISERGSRSRTDCESKSH